MSASSLRNVVQVSLALLFVVASVGCGGGEKGAPIRVGVLHSLTGTMAISEKSVVDATLLAVEEINAAGGVMGRRVEPVVVDGKSDWPAFAAGAEQLITHEKVDVVFGCWTSASRKTVRKVFERHDHLLFYPLQYEGLEQSPSIVYTGASPNQQIIPAVKWCMDKIGKRLFLVGSDYVFPRTANAIIRAEVQALRGEIVGEEYILLGGKDVAGIAEKIAAANPDVIVNTINGDSNVPFFAALATLGRKIPVMSFSIAEEELRQLPAESLAGNYASWNYFQSVEGPENRSFVQRFRKRYGAERVTDDPMEAAYFGVYLWKQAVEAAGTPAPREVRKALGGQSYAAPEGLVSIDSENQHTWKMVRIGRIRADGQFDIVWTSDKPIRPVPFPIYRSRQEWEAFLKEMYDGWGGRWANPG